MTAFQTLILIPAHLHLRISPAHTVLALGGSFTFKYQSYTKWPWEARYIYGSVLHILALGGPFTFTYQL